LPTWLGRRGPRLHGERPSLGRPSLQENAEVVPRAYEGFNAGARSPCLDSRAKNLAVAAASTSPQKVSHSPFAVSPFVRNDDRSALTEAGRGVRKQATQLNGHTASARNGPLGGKARLTVPQRGGRDLWPTPVVWSDRGQRHVYDLRAVEVDARLAVFPIYEFRRTLGGKEPEPEMAWRRPARYLM
jgi:hypothetical protein